MVLLQSHLVTIVHALQGLNDRGQVVLYRWKWKMFLYRGVLNLEQYCRAPTDMQEQKCCVFLSQNTVCPFLNISSPKSHCCRSTVKSELILQMHALFFPQTDFGEEFLGNLRFPSAGTPVKVKCFGFFSFLTKFSHVLVVSQKCLFYPPMKIVPSECTISSCLLNQLFQKSNSIFQ